MEAGGQRSSLLVRVPGLSSYLPWYVSPGSPPLLKEDYQDGSRAIELNRQERERLRQAVDARCRRAERRARGLGKGARSRLSRRTIERWLVEAGFARRNDSGLEPTNEGRAVSAALSTWP
jgi:hypothetical protein